jgi:hypothetical protein
MTRPPRMEFGKEIDEIHKQKDKVAVSFNLFAGPYPCNPHKMSFFSFG